MQMMGGYGYATEYDMERHVRTSLVSTIYGGTSEIQREIISQDARPVATPAASVENQVIIGRWCRPASQCLSVRFYGRDCIGAVRRRRCAPAS